MVIFQRRMPPVVAGLIAATLLLSIACAVDAGSQGALYRHLALWPAQVWRGEVWRLVTWPFIEADPLGLIFACILLFRCGADLEERWGSARMLGYAAAIIGVAGAGTCVVALAFPDTMDLRHLAGWALSDAIVVAWALQFPQERLVLYGLISVGGRDLVYGWCALTATAALYYGIPVFLPEILATAAAVLTMTGGFRGWRATRGKRRGKLRIVRDDDDPRWMN